MVAIHELARQKEGPAICNSDGYLMKYSVMNELLWSILEEVFEYNRELFPKDVGLIDDIRTMISINRSLRRSSDSRAIKMRVAKSDIDTVARWRKVHNAKGKQPGEEMHIGYSAQNLLNNCFKCYTYKM